MVSTPVYARGSPSARSSPPASSSGQASPIPCFFEKTALVNRPVLWTRGVAVVIGPSTLSNTQAGHHMEPKTGRQQRASTSNINLSDLATMFRRAAKNGPCPDERILAEFPLLQS